MPSQQSPSMGARYIFFIVASFAILIINMVIMSVLSPEPKRPKVAEKPAIEQKAKPSQLKPKAKAPADVEPEEPPAAAEVKPKPKAEKPSEPAVAPQWVALGSADPEDPFRMLVTLSNKGAAVERVELSSERFRDLEDGTGYLGNVVLEATDREDGAEVQVVGAGTPAAKAGLKKGDLITALDDTKIRTYFDLKRAMAKTKPRQTVRLTIRRQGEQRVLPVALTLHPFEVIQPEGNDPLSFLLTLHQIDKLDLERLREKDADAPKKDEKKDADAAAGFRRRPDIGQELPGLDLRTGTWKVVSHSQTEAVFRKTLPSWNLEVTKTYRLAKVPKEAAADATHDAYHLVFDVSIRNAGDKSRLVAYQLDGPTGLPIEGYWHASKVSRTWGGSGLRDVMVSLQGDSLKMISAPRIASDDLGTVWKEPELVYVGVDAQYFASMLIPQKKPSEIWFAEGQPLRVGPVNLEWPNTVNTSVRLTSVARALAPGEEWTHSYKIFAGPKKPDLLARYGLGELLYYGWFWWVAVPLLGLLHTFYAVIGNYGIAIILLTIVVRSAMFPLSSSPRP